MATIQLSSRVACKRTTDRNIRKAVHSEHKGHRKEARDVDLKKRRDIAMHVEEEEEGRQPQPKRAEKLKEKLLAWKSERDRKRQQMAKKSNFVVKHVKHSPPKYLTNENANKPTRRVTRSYAKSLNRKEEETKTQVKTSTKRTRKEKGGSSSSKGSSAKPLPKSTSNGFAFNLNENVPLTFCFSDQPTLPQKIDPVFSRFNNPLKENKSETFGNQEMDPIARFNNSVKEDIAEPIPKPEFDPIARFNNSLKADDSGCSSKQDIDPIARFNNSLKENNTVPLPQPGTDPIARFNNSLKSDEIDAFSHRDIDPIARFNNSLKAEDSFSVTRKEVDDPITKINVSLKSEDNLRRSLEPELSENEGFGQIHLQSKTVSMETHEDSRYCADKTYEVEEKKTGTVQQIASGRCLRNTPRRSELFTKAIQRETGAKADITHNEVENQESKSPFKGCAGKTPKRAPVEKRVVTEGERFTPRRIKSTSHFKNLVEAERKKLNDLNKLWTGYMEKEELTEDVSGQIRSVIGQSQLLMDQRFKQFGDLVKLHQSHKSEQGATASDLQGFWDMVTFQIEDVNKKFEELEKMKENNWEQEMKKKVKVKKAVEVKKTNSVKVAARQEATKKFKQAMRAKLRSLKSESNGDEVLIMTGGQEKKMEIKSPGKTKKIRRKSNLIDFSSPPTSNEEMSADSLDDEKKTKRLPLRPSTNSQLCDAMEQIKLKSQEPQTMEGKENVLSPINRTPLRRSIRKTPSKYKTSTTEDDDDVWLSGDLLQPSKHEPAENGFLKYLRPSVTAEDDFNSFGLL